MKKRMMISGILGVFAAILWGYLHFGGFGTGDSADPAEFSRFAQPVEKLEIPLEAKVIALGEATHGNSEFQKLKLEVFRKLVEEYGVRAFALEGDAGGCEMVNRYIHGGAGTAEEAVSAIGFTIYRTEEMAELVSYLREYNETAAKEDQIRFYGFDMQRTACSIRILTEACESLGISGEKLNRWEEKETEERIEELTRMKAQLEQKEGSEEAVHFAELLLQHCRLQEDSDLDAMAALRDRLMAENVEWILQQEKSLGRDKIFITGHNAHVAKWGSYDSMGKLLSENQENRYYAIGTDFYKTKCNLPSGSSGRRTNQVFYSRDPLAKAAKLAGFDVCWLDFSKVLPDSSLAEHVFDYTYLGNLGESYSLFMRLLPQSYRMFQPPGTLYDGMIFVAEATPVKPNEK